MGPFSSTLLSLTPWPAILDDTGALYHRRLSVSTNPPESFADNNEITSSCDQRLTSRHFSPGRDSRGSRQEKKKKTTSFSFGFPATLQKLKQNQLFPREGSWGTVSFIRALLESLMFWLSILITVWFWAIPHPLCVLVSLNWFLPLLLS